MNYHNITKDDMLNGDGLRVVLWVSGCEHHCPECQNPETWDKRSGIPYDANAEDEIIAELSKDYVSGITLSGGDPLLPSNFYDIHDLVCWVKEYFPEKTIWIYSGYTYEEIIEDYHKTLILEYCDVLVDGEYKKDLRDVNLKWRGSSNQRVIDVQKSLKEGKVVLHCN